MSITIGVLVGSLSASSINRRLATALTRLAPEGAELVEIPIGDLPLYNRDLDDAYPPVAVAFKEALAGVDALLYVTPEYNRSIPGALKNAVDWASRPWGQNSLGKPSATIGASPGPISASVAQQQLKNILLFSNAPVLGQPEGYIQFTEGLITDDGEVTDESTTEFLTGWIAAFVTFAQGQLNR